MKKAAATVKWGRKVSDVPRLPCVKVAKRHERIE